MEAVAEKHRARHAVLSLWTPAREAAYKVAASSARTVCRREKNSLIAEYTIKIERALEAGALSVARKLQYQLLKALNFAHGAQRLKGSESLTYGLARKIFRLNRYTNFPGLY